jgi:Stage II sporulation protein E (SpoIIE)/GAF domain/PAS fold
LGQERPLGERILDGQGPELAELLELVGEAVTVRDRHDRFVYANRMALHNLGFASVDELRAHPDSSLLDRFVVYDEAGKEMGRSTFPTPRTAAGETQLSPTLMQVVERRTGESRWEQVRVTALRDRGGQVAATVTVAENVTAVKSAEVHTRVLAETGRMLSSSLDYQQTLRNVAWAAVPALADWCLVELADEPDDRRDQVVVAHRNPALRDLAGQLGGLEPDEPGEHSASSRVIDTGDSALLTEVDESDLARIARGPGQLRVLRELGIRSAVVVPMRIRDRTIGAISFYTSDSLRRLAQPDLALAEQLGRRAAVAVENSRLHTMLAGVADTLAQSLAPSPLPELPGWEIAALYQPAVVEERIEVGGDFYEVFDAGPAPLALIGDVTGHGVAAATLTGLMRHGARFSGRFDPQPEAVLRHLDEELRARPSSAMCTALCARIHERRVVLASAGHPPALHLAADGGVTEIPTPGPLLGAFADSEWQAETLAVAPGELMLLYTDGVTETASESGERYGVDRLSRFLSAHAGARPQPLLDALATALDLFRGGVPTDDIAALALAPRDD